MLEAVLSAKDNPETESRYIEYASAIAGVAVAAFIFAAASLGATNEEKTYAKGVFLKTLDSPADQFKVIFAEDVLVPGQVGATFTALDEWFQTLEKTTMPARARELLAKYGNEVGEETKEHWKVLATK
jgi:hypothetical protein